MPVVVSETVERGKNLKVGEKNSSLKVGNGYSPDSEGCLLTLVTVGVDSKIRPVSPRAQEGGGCPGAEAGIPSLEQRGGQHRWKAQAEGTGGLPKSSAPF